MKRCIISVAPVLLALVFPGFLNADEKKPDEKKAEKPTAGALPPHPLDNAFERANTERDIDNALLNNDLYKKAMTEALKARRAQEEEFRKNPKLKDASPAQKARLKFLEVLQEGKSPEKSAAGALPPHSLDDAFEKANSERDIRIALLNHKFCEKAVVEALKAKKAQEEKFKKEPKPKDATPAQAARQKFLEVLRADK